MLRLSKWVLAGVGAAALMASAANAQAGLGQRLDAKEQQLTQDEQTCREVNLAEYAQLLEEAVKNKQRADKAAKKGVPVNQAQVDADLAKAMQMFARAQMAQARHCMLQVQQQAQPPAQPQPPQTEPPPPTPPKQTSMNLPRWASDMLAAHNAARAAVGSPPLNWDPALQEHATARAQEMAQERQLVHASREGRGTERENILSAPIGWSPDQMMGVWVGEKRYFHPGVFPDVCDGDWSQCAHYTQMIWSTTTDIGCGYAQGGGFNWLVCRYNPGGNKDGKPVIADSETLGSLNYKSDEERANDRYDDAMNQQIGIWLLQSYENPHFQSEQSYNELVREHPDIDWTKSANPKYCSANLIGGIAFNFGACPGPPSNVFGVDQILNPLPAGANEVDTKVEQPTIGNQELFRLAQPNEPLPDPL